MDDERDRSVSTPTAALLMLGMLMMLMSSPTMLLAMMRLLLGRKQSSATPLGELVPRWQNFNDGLPRCITIDTNCSMFVISTLIGRWRRYTAAARLL